MDQIFDSLRAENIHKRSLKKSMLSCFLPNTGPLITHKTKNSKIYRVLDNHVIWKFLIQFLCTFFGVLDFVKHICFIYKILWIFQQFIAACTGQQGQESGGCGPLQHDFSDFWVPQQELDMARSGVGHQATLQTVIFFSHFWKVFMKNKRNLAKKTFIETRRTIQGGNGLKNRCFLYTKKKNLL